MCSAGNIRPQRCQMCGGVARVGGVMRGKPERKKRLRRPGRRWVFNITMDHSETEWDSAYWIKVAHNRDSMATDRRAA